MNQTTTSSVPIKTGGVTDRRILHFDSIDEALADAKSLAAAERMGKLRRMGNWTLGQALGHLAGWINYCFDGVPMKMPFVVRIIMRLLKNRILYKPMGAGRNIPGVAGGTLSTEPLALDEGLARFREAAMRLKNGCPSQPHLAFGAMTHEQWLSLNLRHSELHLSFFRVD